MGNHFLVLAAAALIPLIVGSAWYSPLLFAKPWMAATGMTAEKAKQTNMIVNMAVLYLLSFFVAGGLHFIVIHQLGLFSLVMGPKGEDSTLATPGSPVYNGMTALWHSYNHSYRTYKHGAFHGALVAITLALPIIASGAIFEGRGWKYILITWGFWLINLILMGAVICHWYVVEWPAVA